VTFGDRWAKKHYVPDAVSVLVVLLPARSWERYAVDR
jgi:hypothetical protein